jgi:hypothetical protein
VLQTNAYDPFGYTIADLSHTTFANGEGNKYLYNDYLRKQIPMQYEFGLNWEGFTGTGCMIRWWDVSRQ